MSDDLGYERQLVQMQADHCWGIFSCDEARVFSDASIVLSDTVKTIGIDMQPDKKGKWNSWKNTATFRQVWEIVVTDASFKNHGWTVKADPDAVFVPQRLRKYLHNEEIVNASYVQNCKSLLAQFPYGMFGPIEILSREATQAYYDFGRRDCSPENLQNGFNAEDSWMSKCMAHIGVKSLKLFGILHDPWCLGVNYNDACQTDRAAVAFHPYKKIATFSKCMIEALGVPWEAAPVVLPAPGYYGYQGAAALWGDCTSTRQCQAGVCCSKSTYYWQCVDIC